MALEKSQRSLRAWTKQEWGTKSGKKSSETGERYLPKAARDALTPAEYAATTAKKRKDTAAGKQVSKQPERIAKKTRGARQFKFTGGKIDISEIRKQSKKLVEQLKGLDSYVIDDIRAAQESYKVFESTIKKEKENNALDKETWQKLDVPTSPINSLEDWAKFRNITTEELQRLKKESDLNYIVNKEKEMTQMLSLEKIQSYLKLLLQILK